jgi:hypothetical protein
LTSTPTRTPTGRPAGACLRLNRSAPAWATATSTTV